MRELKLEELTELFSKPLTERLEFEGRVYAHYKSKRMNHDWFFKYEGEASIEPDVTELRCYRLKSRDGKTEFRFHATDNFKFVPKKNEILDRQPDKTLSYIVIPIDIAREAVVVIEKINYIKY